MNTPPTYHFLDIWVSTLTQDELINYIISSIEELSKKEGHGHGKIIANQNLHSLYLYHTNNKMRDFYTKPPLVYMDGMSIIALGKILGLPFSRCHRCTLIDFLYPLLKECSSRNWRVASLGSTPDVGTKAVKKIKEEIPNCEIFTHHGFFDTTTICQENLEVLKKLKEFSPQVLLVGLGMPKQEHWILDNLESLPNCIIINAGAIMEYIAGTIPTPPRFLGQLGLEWLYRLISEPKKLWRRYLIEPWYLAPKVLKELVKRRGGK